jgi:hypothetical protein
MGKPLFAFVKNKMTIMLLIFCYLLSKNTKAGQVFCNYAYGHQVVCNILRFFKQKELYYVSVAIKNTARA